jgi:hypothetical protein
MSRRINVNQIKIHQFSSWEIRVASAKQAHQIKWGFGGELLLVYEEGNSNTLC